MRDLARLVAALVIILAPCSAVSAQNMPVSQFLSKADGLKRKGPLAFFSSDIGVLKAEIQNSAKQMKGERDAAVKAGRKVAFTLSDAFCVDRYRDEFLDLIHTGTIDIVFANERELHSLYQTADFDTAVMELRKDAKLAVVTRSEKGCVVVTRERVDACCA